ncbi:Peroxidasin-like protein [Merluccius polli]|uniref:Peroxidasin-like protein n=1 Tax=Merluccius polli TaxID=89951 RepID=A0AA47NPX2_MERPO|nr:Peroxidasin-like protein [Merluccius polli]
MCADPDQEMDSTVSVGDTARFSCRARGKPEPTIEWLHNDRPLKRDRTDDQSEPAVWMDGGDLVIRGVRSGVETVRCVANNRAGTARSHTAKLIVYGKIWTWSGLYCDLLHKVRFLL